VPALQATHELNPTKENNLHCNYQPSPPKHKLAKAGRNPGALRNGRPKVSLRHANAGESIAQAFSISRASYITVIADCFPGEEPASGRVDHHPTGTQT
jgi:hypothetical protein